MPPRSCLAEGFRRVSPDGIHSLEGEPRFDPGPLPFLADSDGREDLGDAVALLYFLFEAGAALQCAKSADANDDGRLAVADAAGLLKFLFSGGDALPAPGLHCGGDPITDALKCETSPLCSR